MQIAAGQIKKRRKGGGCPLTKSKQLLAKNDQHTQRREKGEFPLNKY